MGKGKGAHSFELVMLGQSSNLWSKWWSFRIKVLKALKSAGTKIPLKTLVSKFIIKWFN